MHFLAKRGIQTPMMLYVIKKIKNTDSKLAGTENHG